MFDRKKILLISSMLIMLIAANAHPLLGKWIYYKGMALGILLAFGLIKILCEKQKNLTLYANIMFYLCVSNFLDEVFFNPVKFQINDYIFATIVIIWQYIKHKNKKHATVL